LGKRIGPEVGHAIFCLETTFNVQQKKDDGKIWISSGWLYHPELYTTVSDFIDDVYTTMNEAAGGDEKIYE